MHSRTLVNVLMPPLFIYTMVNRVLSKTKVAPVQPLSIPRLELLSCLLLAESVEIVLESLRASLTICNIIFWSDSLDALQ